MIEEEAHRQAEAVAFGMGITIAAAKETFFQPPDDCEIVETVAPPVQKRVRPRVGQAARGIGQGQQCGRRR